MPRPDVIVFDGVEGEAQDKDHKSWTAHKSDGVEGGSADVDQESPAAIAAPFVPGGAVISAAVDDPGPTR